MRSMVEGATAQSALTRHPSTACGGPPPHAWHGEEYKVHPC
jgi:hypothetical protein